jgi:hypothetical protein
MKHRQRGQSVVIFALILGALILVGGMLLDGGFAWSNRRAAQTAADSGALAGARAMVQGGDIVAAAQAAAGANSFPAGNVSCPGGGQVPGVIVNRPPLVTTNGALRTPDYVEVIVTRLQLNTLSSIIPGQGCWLVSARAVAYGKVTIGGGGGSGTATYAPAVIAGRHGCSDHSTLTWGGHNVTINGDVFSNGGADWSGDGTVSGNLSWVQHPPTAGCGDNSFNTHGNTANIVTTQTYTDYPLPYRDYTKEQLCAQEPGKIVFDIGDVTDIDSNPAYLMSANPPVLRDGVYCATGKGDWKGSKIAIKTNGTQGKVTLVAEQITISGSNVHLTPYYPQSPATAQLTVYAYGTGSSTVNWSGADGIWQGIVFAPNGNIHLTGAGNGVAGSLWGYTVDFTGKDTTLSAVALPAPVVTPGPGAQLVTVVRLVE